MKYIVMILALVVLFISFILYKAWPQNIEEGQIWVKEYNLDNPYEHIKRDTCYVIETKGDFVLYKRNGKIENERKRWFTLTGRKIK